MEALIIVLVVGAVVVGGIMIWVKSQDNDNSEFKDISIAPGGGGPIKPDDADNPVIAATEAALFQYDHGDYTAPVVPATPTPSSYPPLWQQTQVVETPAKKKRPKTAPAKKAPAKKAPAKKTPTKKAPAKKAPAKKTAAKKPTSRSVRRISGRSTRSTRAYRR